MSVQNLFQFSRNMETLGVHFFYQGIVTEQMLLSVGEALRMTRSSADNNGLLGLDKAAFAVFVEQVQNIIRYTEQANDEDKNSGEDKTSDDDKTSEKVKHSHGECSQSQLGRGVICLGVEASRFFIECGNSVTKEKSAALKKNLSDLQTLSRDGLKSLYKETLKQAPSGDSLGAGVGFIEMALRAKNGFEFSLDEQDTQSDFFSLKVIL